MEKRIIILQTHEERMHAEKIHKEKKKKKNPANMIHDYSLSSLLGVKKVRFP
jgi:uncharacterized small protein (DUF1192 family)